MLSRVTTQMIAALSLVLVSLVPWVAHAQPCPPPPSLRQKLLVITRFPAAPQPGALTPAERTQLDGEVKRFIDFVSAQSGGALRLTATRVDTPGSVAAADYQIWPGSAAAAYTQQVDQAVRASGYAAENFDGLVMVYRSGSQPAGSNVINNTWIYYDEKLAAPQKRRPGFTSAPYLPGNAVGDALIHEYLHQLDHQFQVDAGDADSFMNPDDMTKPPGQALSQLTGAAFAVPMDYYKAMLRSYVGSDGKLHPVDYTKLAGKRGTLADAYEQMRWGMWKGKLTQEIEGKDFDVAFGGHGKFWSTSRGERTVELEFRSMADQDVSFASAPPGSLTFQFGHGVGVYKSESTTDYRYVDGFREQKPSKLDEYAQAEGRGVFGPSPRWSLNIASVPKAGSNANLTPRYNLSKTACPDGVIEDATIAMKGNPATYFFSRSVTTWRFELQGQQKPAHVTMAERLPRDGDVGLEQGIRNFLSRLDRLLRGEAARLIQQRQHARAIAVQQLAADAQRSFTSQDRQAISDSWNGIRSTYAQLSSLWISNQADADARYQERLKDLEAAMRRWDAAKATTERNCQAEAERSAAAIEADDAIAAAELRAMADTMRTAGAVGFEHP